MFVVGHQFDVCAVSDSALVSFAFGILTLVVLNNSLLFVVLDALPVGFKGNIENSIMTEH